MPKKKPDKKPAAKKTGPAPETLKIEGNWQDAVKKAVQKKRPADGWPKPDPAKCKHERIVKERILGAHTGDYKCADCGETFTPQERDAL